MANSEIVTPGPSPRVVCLPSGEQVRVPDDWALLPPGDAGLTRRVKAAGPTLVVQEKRGRKVFSRGVWAPQVNIEEAQAKLDLERTTPAYQKRLAAGRTKRAAEQERYVASFEETVAAFLGFHPRHAAMAEKMAALITRHATPVGSGTVARTQRIPIEKRAEAAVIAWMRHETTGYDDMAIPRVKGARREVRRLLAQRSKQLLARYRRGDDVAPSCPLAAALRHPHRD
ncbi:MAG: DUF2293 domain-containing protein [Myxococcales bacterium]|nr:DUF2293 domain-containing protein [Myxococcales bacterium]